METIEKTVRKVLDEIKEPSTKGALNSTILERFKSAAGFKTFNEPSLKRALDECARFSASLNFTQPYWLTWCGPCANGKTFLARKVWRVFMDFNRFEVQLDSSIQKIYGNTGLFVDWRDLCADVRSGSGWGRVEDICAEHFVILDDLGTEHDPNGFIASVTDRILAARVGKWTFITTNLSFQEVSDKIDARAASRMLRNNGVVIETQAPDYNTR